MKDNGTPIHPEKDQQGYNPLAFPNEKGQNGMTLLDYFAGKIIQAAYASQPERISLDKPNEYVEYAYEVAEAMLEERQKYFKNEKD